MNRGKFGTGNFIAKKIADKLKTLKGENPKFYCEIWDSLAPFVKIGAMEEEKFAEQVENLIIFETDREDKFKDVSSNIIFFYIFPSTFYIKWCILNLNIHCLIIR